MRWICCLLMLSFTLPAAALSRIELSIGRIEAAVGQARDLRVDWHLRQGHVTVQAQARLPTTTPIDLSLRGQCGQLRTDPGLHCTAASLQARSPAYGRIEATFDLSLTALDRWTLALHQATAHVDYNAPDGRVAGEGLRLRGSGRARRDTRGYSLQLSVEAPSGQAYVEPVFLDLQAAPLRLQTQLQWRGRGHPLHLSQVEFEQAGLGRLQLRGAIDNPAAPAARHRLQASLETPALDRLVATYVTPLLAGTRLQDLAMTGRAQAQIHLQDRSVRSLDLEMVDTRVDSSRLGLMLEGVAGTVHWHAEGKSSPSQLGWQSGRVVNLPLGGTRLRFQTQGRALRVLEPVRIPVLDGALRIQSLALQAIGTDNPAAAFEADLDPIDLSLLGRSLGWPEFGGRISGHLPGLRLQNRELSLDGALTAQVFDGEITIDGVRILDPFGVLPRVRAELRLRRLDLETITRAFSFGRITGRLDGDIRELRLLGWAPVAMQARLYSTPGDRASRRISQRAIDNISSIGGGPTGVLSRGALSLFEDFAYARMGWSCKLADGICHMDGIAPAPDSRDGQAGYILVEGRWLPRIDVIGYTRSVNWTRFINQIGAVRNAQGVEVR